MGRSGGAQTWRLVRLVGWTANQPCRYCGLVHEYLVRPRHGGGCQPVLLPPGVAHATSGVEVEAFLTGPVTAPDAAGAGSDDLALARQVAARGVRCERCGAHFDDLNDYAQHRC